MTLHISRILYHSSESLKLLDEELLLFEREREGGGGWVNSLVHMLNRLSTFRGSTLAMWLMSKDSIGLDSREGIFTSCDGVCFVLRKRSLVLCAWLVDGNVTGPTLMLRGK